MRPRRRFATTIALAALVGMGVAAAGQAAPPPTHEVLVGYSAGPASPMRVAALDAVDATADRGVPGVRGMRVLTLPTGESAASAADRLDQMPGVRWAMPNRFDARFDAVPNDPLFGQLWGMQNTGQLVNGTAGTPGVDSGATRAWDTTTGSKDIAVAVLDSGVAPGHPDLVANLASALGRNFLPAYADRDNFPYTSGVDPGAWDDVQGHGTHVAGTIAAVGGNGLGVTGMNWHASIVPVRIGFFDGAVVPEASTNFESVAYAATHARVVNMSFGGEGPPGSAAQLAYEDVFAQHPGTLFVAAAGNGDGAGNGVDNDGPTREFPCSVDSPNVICVAALNEGGTLTPWSNYGATTVDLAAPGNDIMSTEQAFMRPVSDPSLTTFGTWAQSPAGAWTTYVSGDGEHIVRLGDNATPLSAGTWDLSLPAVSTVGGHDCRFTALAAVSLNGTSQTFQVLASATGIAQRVVMGPTGLGGDLAIDLSGFDNASNVQLTFRAIGTTATYGQGQAQYVLMAEPELACITAEPADGAYGFKSGTSMATPMVVGAAALVLSSRPDLTVAQLRGALLNTTTPMASLTGKVATGGRLDVAAAVASVARAPEKAPDATPPGDAPVAASTTTTLRAGATVTATSRNRRVSIPVACTATPGTHCRFDLVIQQRVKEGGRLRWRTWGVLRRQSVPAGWRGRRLVPLGKRAHDVLSRHATARVSLAVMGLAEDLRTATGTTRTGIRIRRH